MKKLKAYFFTGLIASLPFFLTAFILIKIFQMMIKQINDILPIENILVLFLKYFDGNVFFAKNTVLILTYLLTFIIIYISIIILGIILVHFISAEKIKWFEEELLKIPLVKPLYNTIKQIREVVFSKKNMAYKRVLWIEYPRKGIYSLGFLTNEKVARAEKLSEKKLINVFIPTSPNPTSGMFLMVPLEDVIEVDITIEEAIKLIISGGAILPEFKRGDEQ